MPFIPDKKSTFVPDKPAATPVPVQTAEPQVLGSSLMAPEIAKEIGRRSQQSMGEALSRAGYSAGGAITDVLAPHVSPEVAAAAGYLGNLATGLAVPGGGAKVTEKAAPVVARAARGAMQSALKPTLGDLEAGKAQRAIDLMLGEGKKVSAKDLLDMRREIDGLQSQVESAIKRSGETIDRDRILSGMKEVFDRFKDRISQSERSGDIQAAIGDFMNHPWIKAISGSPAKTEVSPILSETGKAFTHEIPAVPQQGIPVEQAQALKQGIYRSLGERAYGPQAIPQAGKEAMKGLAHNLRTAIEEKVPDVAEKNARVRELINAANVATRRHMMSSNRNFGGIGWMMHNPLSFGAWEFERSPYFMSALANWLNRNQQSIARIPGEIAGAPLGMITETPPQNVQK